MYTLNSNNIYFSAIYSSGKVVESRWKSLRTEYTKLQNNKNKFSSRTEFQEFVWVHLYFLKKCKNSTSNKAKDFCVFEERSGLSDNSQNIENLTVTKQLKNNKANKKFNPMMEITNLGASQPLLIKKEPDEKISCEVSHNPKPVISNNEMNHNNLSEIIIIDSDEDEQYQSPMIQVINKSEKECKKVTANNQNLEGNIYPTMQVNQVIHLESSQVNSNNDSNIASNFLEQVYPDNVMDVEKNSGNINNTRTFKTDSDKFLPFLELKTSSSQHKNANNSATTSCTIHEPCDQSDDLFQKYEIVSNNVKQIPKKYLPESAGQQSFSQSIQEPSEKNSMLLSHNNTRHASSFANNELLVDSVILADALFAIKADGPRMICLNKLKKIMQTFGYYVE